MRIPSTGLLGTVALTLLGSGVTPAAEISVAAPPHQVLERNELLRLFGHANAFKEGDLTIGVAAPDEAARRDARERLSRMALGDLSSSRFVDDDVSRLLTESLDSAAAARVATWTVGDLKAFCFEASEEELRAVRGGLSSEAIAACAKLMTDEQLKAASARIFNVAPGDTLGARGVLGSRIQPNSPTDDPEEVLFSVLEGFSYGCGDAVIGVNPVDSDHGNVRRLEETLRDIVTTFGVDEAMHYCVLAHIDDQIAVDGGGLVDVGFQSLGGTEKTLATFNVDNAKMIGALSTLGAQYFETGQGSSFTNNAAEGVDMVTLESRAHGLARAYGLKTGNWMIVNDVAGFIGPEVFSSAQQLLRACLEDLFMGKMHGLTMGLDICSTYHMGVGIDDLDRIMDEVIPAGPAYFMAVAGKSDPMLSYITTAYRDHPRMRAAHGLTVTDQTREFFVSLGVMRPDGSMTEKAGDTAHVYVQYRRRKGDGRSEEALRAEAAARLAVLQQRGLDLGYGHDGRFGMPPEIRDRLYRVYADSKRCLQIELPDTFLEKHRDALLLETSATDRRDYVLHPPRGEVLSAESLEKLREMRAGWAGGAAPPRVQVILSDGLNAESLSAEGQLDPFLRELKAGLARLGLRPGRDVIVRNGRVRAGYQVGQELFGGEGDAPAATVHLIGERPGNGQNTYSAYIGLAPASRWKRGIDHDVARVVSGVSITATPPSAAARQSLEILEQFFTGKPAPRAAP